MTPVKINIALLKGINDDEVENFIKLTAERPLTVRFIELMPTNHSLKEINESHFISVKKIREKIMDRFLEIKEVLAEKSCGPASYYHLLTPRDVWLITAVSQHFCTCCNRIRLTAEAI